MSRRALTQRLLQSFCVFLLLFAQQAALTHAVLHAAAEGGLGVATAAATHEGDEEQGLTPACALDAVFGQVLGAAPASSAALILTDPAGDTRSERASALVHLDPPRPLSRGPPVLS